MIEMRLGDYLYRHSPTQHLSEVRKVVECAGEATWYIQDFAEAHGMVLDFAEINDRRCAALPTTHPFVLIQPYIRRDVTPFISDGTDSTPSDSDSTGN